MDKHTYGPITIYYIHRWEWDIVGRQAGVYTGPDDFVALVPHHTVTGWVRAYFELVVQKMRYLQTLRPDLGSDIPYNWVVFSGKDGNEAFVAEGRGLGWTGAHTYGWNRSRHAASFWGNSDVDPVEPSVLEAMRFCGRLMTNAYAATATHGQYPEQYTACAGAALNASVGVLQPPFTPAYSPGPSPNPTEGTDDMGEFHVRLDRTTGEVSKFDWNEGHINFTALGGANCLDSAIVRIGDTVTVSLDYFVPDVTVSLLESNGHQQGPHAVQWGQPVSFVVSQGSGWTSVLCTAGRAKDLRVEWRR